jgi:hypothetical protein
MRCCRATASGCALPPQSLPQMREAQMQALELENVGYSTNADQGFGCNIHPSRKQACSVRLAHAALAQVYKQPAFAQWRSPSYKASKQVSAAAAGDSITVRVTLNDLSPGGLKIVARPYNYVSPQYGSNESGPFVPVDCTATFPAAYPNRTKYNASMSEQCAWAALNVPPYGWLNASVAVDPQDGQAMLLTATLPRGGFASRRGQQQQQVTVAGSSCEYSLTYFAVSCVSARLAHT